MSTKNIMIVGVGGQGSVLASKLLGNLLTSQGFDVKVSEVHGMSQRGGSVVTYVKYGDKVYSPVIEKGEADFIVSFEILETARWLEYLKPDGQIVTSTQQIDPMPVLTDVMKYPEKLLEKIKAIDTAPGELLFEERANILLLFEIRFGQLVSQKKQAAIMPFGHTIPDRRF